MTSKLRLKLGPIEIDYEGSEEFMKEELPALIEAVTKLYKASGLPPEALTNPAALATPGAAIQGTTATYAAKLGGGSGTELALAAAARLTFGLSTPTFSRTKLLEEMQSARTGAQDEFLLAATAQNLRRMAKWLVPRAVNLGLAPA